MEIWSFYGMISLIFLVSIVGYGAMIFVTNPHVKDITAVSNIRTAMRNIGLEKPVWRTLIISASQDVRLPLPALWEAWTHLEDWVEWGKPYTTSTRWVGEAGWRDGARFEQVVDLGFPLGRRRTTETVEGYAEMRLARWCRISSGMRSCHIWSFTVLPNGRARVTNTEVFHGTFVGLIKPIVAARWQKLFDATVTGLVAHARASNSG